MTFQLRSQGRQALELLVLAALCFSTAMATAAARQAGGDTKMQADSVLPFQGNWDVAKASLDGTDIPGDILKDLKVKFKGNELAMTMQGEPIKATIKVDTSKKPSEIDIDFGAGNPPKFGIFEIAGDTIKIHAVDDKAQRPKDFKGDASIVIVIKRAAPDKNDKVDKTDKKSRGQQVSLVSLAILAQDKKTAKTDKDLVQGAWSVESAIDDGMALPDELRDVVKFLVEGNKIEIKMGDLSHKGTFTVDETAKPKKVDIKLEGDTDLIGIYEMTKDQIKFCLIMVEPGKDRPTDFKAEAGSGRKLVVLKRAKEEKKGDPHIDAHHITLADVVPDNAVEALSFHFQPGAKGDKR